MRNSYMGNTFFDASASAFFLQNSNEAATSGSTTQCEPRTSRESFGNEQKVAAKISGASVGPNWVDSLKGVAADKELTGSRQPLLDVQFECELGDVCDARARKDRGIDARWPVSATLTNGVVVDCDFVVSATGVQPNTSVVGSEFEVNSLLCWSRRLCLSNQPCHGWCVNKIISALSRDTAGVYSLR